MIYEEEKSLINIVLHFTYEWKNAVIETPMAWTSFICIHFSSVSPIPTTGKFCPDSLCDLFKTVKPAARACNL